MATRLLLLCAFLCQFSWGAEPLLWIDVYDQSGVRLAGEPEIRLVSTMSGEDLAGNLKGQTGHYGHVPEGTYRVEVSFPGFETYRDTIRVSWPRTDICAGLIVPGGDLLDSSPTTELISGYVDTELSKGRDLWVQAYPVFRPQEPRRVTRTGPDGHFEISVPVKLGPWVLVVFEMFAGESKDLPRTEQFPFPKVVGSRVVHTSDMPMKIALE